MILPDTSVWVDHFRSGNHELASALQEGQVVCHPFIIGELACGHLRNRVHILSLLATLPAAPVADHDEVMHVIEQYRLMGKGLGYIDVHLLASSLLTNVPLWTLDRRLGTAAASIKIKK